MRTEVRALFLGAIRMALEMLLEEEVRSLVGAFAPSPSPPSTWMKLPASG
ncbi:hypothetical protein MYSTI_01548 [Myxococcus stipitatus DSM 14675]|uniref:Uncharacterized protein n=1 Tax=Myxococcus stipitatus (strain DSM 14675 / JCM 12634 / Mx s8) TaxID=1278073 RepID=L7U3Y0_MYXSD|nr:hypothetical protein MYSTI_01548 [Myxococcus stipitatus DSM 14675]